MFKNIVLFCIALISTTQLVAQESYTFGQLSDFDKNFTVYEKDSTANAVVLYEKGNNQFLVIDNKILIEKKYYVKIKILKKEGLGNANIIIPFKSTEKISEIVFDINAITHNKDSQNNLSQSDIYRVGIGLNLGAVKFAFPNVKVGSIIEYEYTLLSPFIYNFKGWEFQSNIPKIYSEFNAKIPGNYKYNRSLIGFLKLDINESKKEKNCFNVGFAYAAECEVLKYAINDIPAFDLDEEFTLSPLNYLSRIDFELASTVSFNIGKVHNYTASWEDVDKEFKKDKNIGRQLTKKGFFEKNVPESLLTEGDSLTRAKNIFNFVKDRFTWNNKYGIYRDIRVKSAFDNKTGNIGEINISLINLLNSAGLKTDLVLLSTRSNGLPKKSHPVISDFNYVIAKTVIGGKTYLLDASDKLMPFGMLPYRALNYQGRVMDFKNDSYWETITPEEDNQLYVLANLALDPESHKITGSYNEMNSGYLAIERKKVLNSTTEDDYLNDKEKEIGASAEIDEYNLVEEQSNEKRTVENFSYTNNTILDQNTLYINPFLVKSFDSTNPFTAEERKYPVDFGFKRTYTYAAKITIPTEYTIEEIPKNINLSLPNKGGRLQMLVNSKSNLITVSFKLIINKEQYSPNEYFSLKELFKQVTNAQNNSLIVLKKA
ncbi:MULTISPECIES: DUF3858 domain-containing protein [unclassified Cellulophaga]|uniref:DUF3858 domain-containing protein n=1 Tax=unclassified Cellulophaga TaxID=2634405 RepID=UPI0026E24B02|nr:MULTISPECIES: DUF3858 domain-containing protein [unclassified Cellulophaga]MDO6490680.1 DUF3858 domain-containing protein [Cellulophaga sp. 2_MG-2023]MDO6494126.1 DUF3858 domain-containing protein [Cellulophaga sp. 3_MG-2023]